MRKALLLGYVLILPVGARSHHNRDNAYAPCLHTHAKNLHACLQNLKSDLA